VKTSLGLRDVLATYERARYPTKARAQECLAEAESFLRPHYSSVTHEAALELAIRYDLTVCEISGGVGASKFAMNRSSGRAR
jgi:hypothetical protein